MFCEHEEKEPETIQFANLHSFDLNSEYIRMPKAKLFYCEAEVTNMYLVQDP